MEKTTQEGIDAFEEGEYAKALKSFQMVAKKQPFSAFALRDVGHAAFHLNDLGMALDHYTRALQVQPSLLDARFNTGLIHMKRGHVNDAMFSLLETLHRLHPIASGAYYLGLFYGVESLGIQCRLNLGTLFKERGELEKALDQYRQVLDARPDHVLALGSVGDCLMALERFEEAIRSYKRALKGLPEGEERRNLQNDLGVCFFKMGDLGKAVGEFKDILKRDPDHVNAIYNLGQVYFHGGMTGRVREDYEEFVKGSKNAASILFSLSKSMVSAATAQKGKPSEENLLIGESPSMRRVKDLLKRAAASDATVLILGESGTGKELAARSIQRQSSRHDKPFVPIACSALSESLLESELFGHEKGAFTGAIGQKAGKFETAHQGTVFLDEIGEISLATQVKLLRVLQEREFERVGGTQTLKVDLRVIAATHRDLKKCVQEGSFREDLFYRLNVIVVEMPPLREREGDLGILIKYFLEKLRLKRTTRFTGIDPEALKLMRLYPWPGNVRELENVMERIVTLNDDLTVHPGHLPDEVAGRKSGGLPGPSLLPLSGSGVLERAEKDVILKVLEESKFNKKQAATRLGISRPTLYQKIRKYGLEIKK